MDLRNALRPHLFQMFVLVKNMERRGFNSTTVIPLLLSTKRDCFQIFHITSAALAGSAFTVDFAWDSRMAATRRRVTLNRLRRVLQAIT